MSNVYLGREEARALVGRYFDDRRFGRFQQPQIYQGNQPGFGGGMNPFEARRERHEHREMHREEWERLHPGEDWFERERRRMEWERRNPGVPFVGAEALVGALANANPMVTAAQHYGIAPKAVMVPYPMAEQAQRQTLPMNTGGSVVTTTVAALITSRPQRQAFRPERVFVSNASSPTSTLGAGGAADWLLNDISIGNRSQYVQAGSLPGDIFQSTAIDSYVTFETAQTAMDVTMSVTYNGTGTTGEVNGLPFWGSIHGTAAV
jgi:hypothetical protein